MRRTLLIGLFSFAALAQTPSVAPAAPPAAQTAEKIQAGMAAALAQQRASVIKQVSAATGKVPPPAASFFTVPWIESPVAFTVPPCDPLPAGQLDDLVQSNSKQQGVKPDLIRAVIDEESGGRPCAVSWKGAQGLMQLMPATAQRFGVTDTFDPKQNIEAGVRYLKFLQDTFQDDRLAIAAYNAGENAVAKYKDVPPYPETLNYVAKVGSKYGQAKRAAKNARQTQAIPDAAQANDEPRHILAYVDAEGKLHIATQ